MTSEPSATLVPLWLVRAAAVGWRLLAVLGLGVVVLVVANTIPVSATAILVSLVFAAALAPTAIRLRARGLSRAIAAAATFAAGAALVVGAVVVLVLVLLPDLRAIAAAVDKGFDALREWLHATGPPSPIRDVLERIANATTSGLTPDLSAVASTLADLGTVIVLGTFLTYFLLADGDRGWAWAMRSLRPWQVDVVSQSASNGLDRVAWYVRRTAMLAAIDALVVWAVLSVFGVPLAGGLGAVAFVAGFVPYLGAVAGGLVIGLATLALAGPVAAVAVLAALVATWVVSNRVLATTAMGRSADVNPVLVLVAIPAGLALFGVLGLLAVLPVTVFALAIGRSVIAALDLAPSGALDATRDGEPASRERPPGIPDGVPTWLERVAQWSWRALVLAALVYLTINLVVATAAVVVPAVLAVVAAATLLPLVDRLQQRGWNRGVATVVSTGAVLVVVVSAVVVAIAMTVGPLREVIVTAAQGAGAIDLAWLRDVVLQAGQGLELHATALLADTVGIGLALLIALLMTFFFLRDGRDWWGALLARLATGRRGPVGVAGTRSVEVLSSYMIGTAAISAFGGLSAWLVMVILGLPLGFPIAVIGFFAGFIPYIGSFITTGIALLVTIALGTPSDIVWMLVFTVVFNIVQGNIVTPIVYGKGLDLHPAIVLMAVPVGNEIAGILGMFLVVPAAAMIAATWRLLPSVINAAGLPPPRDPGPGEAVPTSAAPTTSPAGAGT